MSSNTRDRRRIVSSLLLAMMFLFADLALPQAVPDWSNEVLDDEKTIFQTLSTFNSSKDTAIDSSNPTTNFGSDETVNLGSSFTGESKILISFNNTVPATDLVTDAILKLTCGIDPLEIDVINIYNSRLLKSWDEANATWSDADDGVAWQLPGAEGTADYESWEPPFYGYANNTFSINVTAVVQDAVANSRSSIDLVIAATGAQYECQMSETQNFGEWPYLQISHQTGTHSNGGSLTPNFVEDGAALMDSSQFALSAATNPELSWEGLTGNHAQIQLSMSENFLSNDDDNWYYNTKDNSSLFTLGSGNGEMTVPTGDDLSNSSTMFYRMRSIDSTETIGPWVTGYFHLPGHSIAMSGNYGTLSVGFDDLGLNEFSIEDTFIDSNNKNANLGSEENFTVGSSSSSDQYGLMRLNMDHLGLHHNSSIISANIDMTRDSFSGSADVSMHLMDGEEWTEDGVTWKRYDGTNYWDDGGRVPSMSVGNFTGSQSSSTIEVNITVALQHWIDENNDAIQAGLSPESSLDLLMVASTFGIEESSTQSVKICATESSNCNQPKIEITYDWDSNGPPDIPTHVSPLDGHGAVSYTHLTLPTKRIV